MSSARGSTARKRPQKHQNRTAFKNDLHDTSHRTKFLNSLEICGVCKRCKDILEWKIKYKKYKPLTAPRKCTNCQEKCIKHAYHMLCHKCAQSKKVCPKCCKAPEDDQNVDNVQNIGEVPGNIDLKSILKDLSERKRRTILRHINKEGDQQDLTPDTIAKVQEMLAKMDIINLDDDDTFFDEENCESEEDSVIDK